VLIEPSPADYRAGKFHIYPSSEHKKYVEKLRAHMRFYTGHFTDPDEPLAMKIIYLLPRKKSVERLLPTAKPDLDNLTKPFLDALKPLKVKRVLKQEGVIPDDAQIVDLYIKKRYAIKTPQIKLHIWKIKVNSQASPASIVQEDLFSLPTSIKLPKQS
jgi:Holliday junction resolvase RusA-like endonuclease